MFIWLRDNPLAIVIIIQLSVFLFYYVRSLRRERLLIKTCEKQRDYE